MNERRRQWGGEPPDEAALAEVRYAGLREHMVQSQIAARGIRDDRLLEALRTVPRHRFVPSGLERVAYEDGALAIGHGQTISQPYIVALMTSLLGLRDDSRLLEVGTGSGYQAAVAAAICREVWSVERIPELAAAAEVLLLELGYTNVHVVIGDGRRGLPEQAPFDAVIITAATATVPPALLAQLVEGGRLVAPVGPPRRVQQLIVYERRGAEYVTTYSVECRFVPLINEEEAGDEGS